MRQLLCDDNIEGNLASPNKVAKFMGVKKASEITAEMQGRVDAFFVQLATGDFDEVLMQWGGLNKTLAADMKLKDLKEFLSACMGQMTGQSCMCFVSWLFCRPST